MSTDTITICKDDYLIREGEESTQMFYLQSGSMAVMKRKGDQEVQIGTVHHGEVVGEMSFLDKEPRCASVRALTDCTLVVVPHAKFDKLFKELPVWYTALVSTLLDRLRRANARIKI
jgi:CRP-like cAMP-binding protein